VVGVGWRRRWTGTSQLLFKFSTFYFLFSSFFFIFLNCADMWDTVQLLKI
jgi:hypothetical protein